MIKFKKLTWSNAFSYGPDNSIQLDDASLTQLVGKNGHGKSSIALILEEVLFNTNSKKIKRGDVLNRHLDSKNYSIAVEFDKDGQDYEIRTTRTAATANVKLYLNSSDISSHTATATYKQIEEILGYDHKTFSQIVYQSSVSSLEFLTATDTARKKFLIELLNLSVYTKASEVFKEQASAVLKLVSTCETKVSTIKGWLAKYEKEDLALKDIEEELASPEGTVVKITLLENDLLNIESSNKRVIQNNKYKEILAGIKVGAAPEIPESATYLLELQTQLAMKKKVLADGKTLSGTTAMSTCKSCNQIIDNSTRFALAQQFEAGRSAKESEIVELTELIRLLQLRVSDYKAYKVVVAEYEKYHALVDTELSSLVLDKDTLVNEIAFHEANVRSIRADIAKTRAANKLAEAHNAKVAVISAQLVDMRKDLVVNNAELVTLEAKLTTLQILVKAFSTTGVVAYKIECLVKDLEHITNEYLGTLADGRFQLSFKIASSDKLNVVITDNGRDIDICALSSGERARVNVATLLAIRKLMQTLSNSRTNLLILDETVENLDAEGKEKLIEVLLEEQNLNTFLISHGFSHPLLEKINIVKENNISRIE
jgi:DNA repair exonuclease SbcCD ATPase subunit